MTRPAVRALLIWLLAMLAGSAVVWNSHFSADMSFFLPARRKVNLGTTSQAVCFVAAAG